MNVYSDNSTYAAVASTLSATAPIQLSNQNALSVDLSSYLTTAVAASTYQPILTFSNPGSGAISMQYGNTVPALKGGPNVLVSSSFDGTYIQISVNLSAYHPAFNVSSPGGAVAMMVNNLLLALYGGTCVKLYVDSTNSFVTISLDQTVAYTVGALTCTNSALA